VEEPIGLDQFEVQRVGPNVLTVDYCELTIGGETKSNLYCYQAGEVAFQKNGLAHNPWDHAVQFKDELIAHRIPPNDGFTASYHFNVNGTVPADLAVAIERTDLYEVSCNGKRLTATSGEWWLDKAFQRINIAAAACSGDNVISLHATNFTMFHEIEPLYILGDFNLSFASRGFAIESSQPLHFGKWNEQGLPLYSDAVRYSAKCSIASTDGRFLVTLPSWLGSVARVKVNGKQAGIIGWPPWQCDVSKLVKKGDNQVEVAVVGTLKNTLGPHHGSPQLGAAWPSGFRVSPKEGQPNGSQYSTVGYGLFEPFNLKRLIPSPTANGSNTRTALAK
jgi:hypothetical protein